jgi:hypothetical protein
MTELVPSRTRHSEVAAILERVEREGIKEIDAQKETRYAKQLDGQRFAIVDDSNGIVGYLSGRYSGGWAPSPDVAREDVVAFVSLIVIDKDARGEGHAVWGMGLRYPVNQRRWIRWPCIRQHRRASAARSSLPA